MATSWWHILAIYLTMCLAGAVLYPSVKRCCQDNQILCLTQHDVKCVMRESVNVTWSWTPTSIINLADSSALVGVGFPVCGSMAMVLPENNYMLTLLPPHSDLLHGNVTYSVNRFCLEEFYQQDSANESQDAALICPWIPVNSTALLPSSEPRVPKCCPLNQVFSEDQSNCVPIHGGQGYIPVLLNSQNGAPIRPPKYTLLQKNDTFCPPQSQHILDSKDEFYLLDNGYLYIPRTRKTYGLDRFCIDGVRGPDGKGLVGEVAILCVNRGPTSWKYEDFCRDHVCVQKCCPRGEALTDHMKCKEHFGEFTPVFRNKRGKLVDPPVKGYNITPQKPVCNYRKPFLYFDPDDPTDKFYLLPTGEIYSVRKEVSIKPPKYCIERYFNDTHALELGVFCMENNPDTSSYWVSIFYPIGMFISCFVLLLTLLVYGFIPELRNFHGRTLMGYVLTLLMTYILIISSQILSKHFDQTTCVLMALLSYYFLMSVFFWLNVMCFDIWVTFRGITINIRTSERERWRLLRNCLYAWGCPFLMVTIVLIIDNVEEFPYRALRPRIGDVKCWFQGDIPLLLYFYGPVGVLLLSNVIFFSLTAYRLVKVHKETKFVRQREKNKERFILYIKLFLVMGLVWITEIVSWKLGPEEMWYITDIANTLQGLIVFVIFVCKKDVWAKIKATVLNAFGYSPESKSGKTSSIELSKSYVK